MPLALLAVFASPLAGAAGTAAGTTISNTASATYTSSGVTTTSLSNTDSFRVAELIALTVASNDAGAVIVNSPDSARIVSLRLTNTGNGDETFRLAATGTVAGDDFDPSVSAIYLDANGNGLYDAADTLYSSTNEPTLAPNASIVLFVVSDIPAGRAPGERGFARLTATSATGTGAGTTVAGAGTGGTDAVIGTTAGIASDNGVYAIDTDYALAKSYAVVGGGAPVAGATVTYTLVLTATGSGTAPAAAIDDPIPAGTSYVAGSLTLDGAPLTDAIDADGGRFTGTAIRVDLPAQALPYTRTVRFRVTVN